MKIQWNIINVFNLHHILNDASNSDIKLVELWEKILTLRKRIKNEKRYLYAILQYILKIN